MRQVNCLFAPFYRFLIGLKVIAAGSVKDKDSGDVKEGDRILTDDEHAMDKRKMTLEST